MELGLSNKVVLVTGASSGIGRATALAFAREGTRLAIGYHNNEDQAQTTAELAETLGSPRALAWHLDITDPDGLDEAVASARDELGPIAVLVNNAVSWPSWPDPGEKFETAPTERMSNSLRANLEAPYRLSRSVVGDMRDAGWGRIVNVSTNLVEDGFPGNVSYIAAKSGLHGLTRVMSRELGPAGILTNVVMPGFTPDDKPIPDTIQAQAAKGSATGRVTEPDDIARVIVFLCSAANSQTTGEAIRVDGHFLSPA
jgi:3-oxoacyl-[acyl-carrier protein] reductase